MIDKYNELKELDIDWHFIGRIQTNKIKYIVQLADYIHSVWRLKEIDEIQKRAESLNKIQKIFLEVNVSGEETKAGLKPSEVDDLIANIVKTDTYQNIEIIGLMTMAPYTDDETVIRRSFSDLRKIRDKLQSSYKTIKELSMGDVQ
jgi:Predicted enzyme with a TIM-barrel fold